MASYYLNEVDTFENALRLGKSEVKYDTLASLMSVPSYMATIILDKIWTLAPDNPDVDGIKAALEFLNSGGQTPLTYNTANTLSAAFSVIQNNSIANRDGNLLFKIGHNSNEEIREKVTKVLKEVFKNGKNDYIAEHFLLTDKTCGERIFDRFNAEDIYNAVVARPDIRASYQELAKNRCTDDRAKVYVAGIEQRECDGIKPLPFNEVEQNRMMKTERSTSGIRL